MGNFWVENMRKVTEQSMEKDLANTTILEMVADISVNRIAYLTDNSYSG